MAPPATRRPFCQGARDEAGPAEASLRPGQTGGKNPRRIWKRRGGGRWRRRPPFYSSHGGQVGDELAQVVVGDEGTVRSLRGRPVAGFVLERISFARGLHCTRE